MAHRFEAYKIAAFAYKSPTRHSRFGDGALRGMFCLAAVLRSDRKEVCHFSSRSLTFTPMNPDGSGQIGTGNALAIAVQHQPSHSHPN
jgi:hypothetical protein